MPLASSWPRRASRRSRSSRSPRAWATASTCSPPAAAPRARASRRCARRSSWSHDLLDRRGARALPAAGASSPAASRWRRPRTCAPAARSRRRQIVDLLARLVDKSLVQSPTGRSASGCSTPSASTRPSAWPRPASTTRVAVRHLDWCLALAEEHDPLSAGPRRSLRTLETEHDNLRAGADLRAAPRPAGRAAPGHLAVALLAGPRLLRRGRPLAGGDAGRRARAHRAARGGPAGQRRARRCAAATPTAYLHRVQAAVADYRELGDEHATAAALYQHAMLEQSVSNTARADALFADAVALAPPPRRPPTAGGRHHASAMTPWYRADREQARAIDRRGARASSRRLPDDDTPFFEVVTFGLCLLHDGPAGPSAPAPRGDDLPLPPLRPRPGHRLCAQQPGLDGARDGRHRAGHARPSTRPWSASAPPRTARARR